MGAIAVVSDVHANLEALGAVLSEVEGLDLYCLGDLVDYGAQPNEVIALLKARGARCIRGNHDDAALRRDTSMFNARAAMSSKWTSGKLTVASREYLRALPLDMSLDLGGVKGYFAHGSPDDRLWEYVDPSTHSDLMGHYLDKVAAGVIGLGHTHVPYSWREGERVVFNPGSVGQPRDGDPRAAFAIVSTEGRKVDVELRRVGYDWERAASKIREAGLPEYFAERLGKGT